MLPDSFRPLFRNYRFELLNPDTASELVIKTTLAYGTWEQIKWLFAYYGRERMREVFLKDFHGCRELPEPTRRLWALAFLDEIPPEDTDPIARWRCRRKVPQQSFSPRQPQPDYLAEVRRLVLEGLRGHSARVYYLYGSQARGQSTRASDIDVAVLPLSELPIGLLATIRENLEESTVPYRVDLVDLTKTDPSFRTRVEQEGTLWSE